MKQDTEIIPKYQVKAYFDSRMAGLDDDIQTDSFDLAIDFAHEKAMSGDYILIRNSHTGEEQKYSPDEWAEAIELGGYPDKVRELS